MINDTVTVLLVEDDDIDAETVIHSFKQMKIANPVRHARDGEEAVSYTHLTLPTSDLV